jgi:hypothetical protein
MDEIIAVTAVPLGDVPVGDSAWQVAPVIPDDYFYASYAHAVTLGITPEISHGDFIPVRKKGAVKDSESDSVAGRLHTVSISCEVDERDDEVPVKLLQLERTPSHLIVTFLDGSTAFCQGTEDTYRCDIDRDGAKTTVSFQVQNIMGLQRIITA